MSLQTDHGLDTFRFCEFEQLGSLLEDCSKRPFDETVFACFYRGLHQVVVLVDSCSADDQVHVRACCHVGYRAIRFCWVGEAMLVDCRLGRLERGVAHACDGVLRR
jgi:hypothetical protein